MIWSVLIFGTIRIASVVCRKYIHECMCHAMWMQGCDCLDRSHLQLSELQVLKLDTLHCRLWTFWKILMESKIFALGMQLPHWLFCTLWKEIMTKQELNTKSLCRSFPLTFNFSSSVYSLLLIQNQSCKSLRCNFPSPSRFLLLKFNFNTSHSQNSTSLLTQKWLQPTRCLVLFAQYLLS